MSFSIRSCFYYLGVFLLLTLNAVVTADYPDVIELVGYNNRHSRTHLKQQQEQQPTATKIQADIETVKQNIDKYNKLLTLDTHGLPDSQKDMLERIVERVARLKESLDINETFTSSIVASSTTETAMTDTLSTIDAEKNENELTTLEKLTVTEQPLGNTEEQDFNTQNTELPTDADFQMIAGRANHNAAITAIEATNTTPLIVGNSSASQRTLTTLGKITKTRATKRPTINHSTNNLQSSSSSSSSSPSSSSSSMPNNNAYTSSTNNAAHTPSKRKPISVTNKQKLTTNSYTTIHPHAQQYQQQQKLQQQLQQQQQAQQQLQQQQQAQQQPLQHKTTLSTAQQQLQQQQQHVIGDDRLTSSAITPQSVVDVLKQSLDANSSNMSLVYSSKQQQLQQLQQQQALPQPSANGYSGGLTLNTNNYNNLNFPSSGIYNSNNNINNNNNDLVYDTKVNATAIINSLNNAREEYYQQQQHKESGIVNKDKMPTATAKPTKYHYYPHNQHIYLLPECAIQQVCNAVYVRLNYTQPLCACPSRYRDPCSASLNEDDQHTTKLIGDGKKKAITLAKTCESTTEMRECRSPKDWSLLALQNTRTGKSHYLVICRCPEYFKMEGPMSHDQPTYASVPGIRVFGMMCVKPGYSVRKPPSQPPKRYQMQNPHYRPGNLGDSLQNTYMSGNLGTSLYMQESTKDGYGRPHTPTISVNNNGAGYHDTHEFYHQSSQYLNRPESDAVLNDMNRLRPDITVGNQLPDSIYGRTNEREGEAPIESTKYDEELKNTSSSSTETVSEANIIVEERKNEESPLPNTDEAVDEASGRAKREIIEDINEFLTDDMPEFPWDRVLEFQQSIVWD